jgi:multiple sugar transport system substrate-binding protein
MVELRGVTWDHVRGYGGLRAAADAYRAERPDVQVSWETRSLQAFADQPVEQLERYDLIVLDHPSIGEAVARGALAPFEDVAADVDGGATSVGRSSESYVWDGRRWALPVDAAAQVAAYRPDLLEQANVSVPATWDDVGALAHALGEHDMTIAMPAIPVDVICAFLGISGAPFEGDRVVDRDAGRRALSILHDVLDVAHPMSLGSNPPAVFAHMAANDDVAYCPLAFGYVTFARSAADGRELRFGPGPEWSGTLGGAGLAVSSASAYVDEAIAFARFACSADVQRGPYVDGGGQPGHRAAWTDPSVDAAANGFFSSTLPALDRAYLRPRFDGFLSFQDAAGELIHGFVRNGTDPDTALDRIDELFRASVAHEVHP